MKKIKQFFLTIGFGKIYTKLYNWYDNVTGKIVECSIADILLLRDIPNSSQLLLTSRLLDVEAYLEKGDESFPYQNTISRNAYGEKHNEKGGNLSFKNLIESYKKHGYRNDSYITCDKNVVLMDGNHRMGLQVYEKIERINARIVRREKPNTNSLDGYYTRLFPTCFIESIFNRYYELQSWLLENGMTFCACFNEYNQNGANLLQDMKRLCTVLKVEKKEEETIVCFSMLNPQYTVKDGQLYSQRAATIERILKKRIGENGVVVVAKNCLEGKLLYDSKIHTA